MFTWRIETAEPGSIDALAAFSRTTPHLTRLPAFSFNIATSIIYIEKWRIHTLSIILNIKSDKLNTAKYSRDTSQDIVLLLSSCNSARQLLLKKLNEPTYSRRSLDS